ncbi:MAG TPA: class I SAM-dependent methyltransferase [Stellaceae bacterium]|nr:class I SAM-dependent methyltransferase [Stellaceae bacterium]
MTETPNAAQRDHWNTVAGPRWVGFGGAIESRVSAVNDLLLARAAPKLGENVLEIGCGTGATTVPLAEAVGETGHVLGIDIAEPMLAAARRRVSESGVRNVSLVLADAQAHSFEPGRFDLIVSRFGVMFFADPTAAFANLCGAARPGGRLCFACWAPLAENPHWLVPYDIVRRRLGPPAPTDPRAPGPLAFSDPDYVAGFLAAAGFADIEIRRETPAIIAESPEAETELALIMGPSGRLIEEKKPDPAAREALKREIGAAFASRAKEGALRLPMTVFLVTARRRQ